MRSKTVLVLTMLVAVLVVNCSKFAIGGSQTSGILTDAQLAPLVIDADDELAILAVDLFLTLPLGIHPP